MSDSSDLYDLGKNRYGGVDDQYRNQIGGTTGTVEQDPIPRKSLHEMVACVFIL